MNRRGFLLGKVLPWLAFVGLGWGAIAYLAKASRDASEYSAMLAQMNQLESRQGELDERISNLFHRIECKKLLWEALVDDRLTIEESFEAFLWLNQTGEVPNKSFFGPFRTIEEKESLFAEFLEYQGIHLPTFTQHDQLCKVLDKWDAQKGSMKTLVPTANEKVLTLFDYVTK